MTVNMFAQMSYTNLGNYLQGTLGVPLSFVVSIIIILLHVTKSYVAER